MINLFYKMDRFKNVDNFNEAIDEINNANKESHWMWYVFPQLEGLGYTEMSKYYSLKDPKEAKEFLLDPVCRSRLLTAFCAVKSHRNKNELQDIFNSIIDCKKFMSCLTLFKYMSKNINDKEINELVSELIDWALEEHLFECDFTEEKCINYLND